MRRGVIDQVLLEEFLWDLEDEMQTWVRQHQPRNCEEALRLVEAFSVSENERSHGQGLQAPVINPIQEEEKMGPQKGMVRGTVCYHCGKVSHVSKECGLGLNKLSHVTTPAPPPRDRLRDIEHRDPMDCSYGSASQEGGWECLVVTAWIGDRAV